MDPWWRSRHFWLPWLLGSLLWLALVPVAVGGLQALHHPAWEAVIRHPAADWPWLLWPRIWSQASTKPLARDLAGLGLAGWGYLRWRDVAQQDENPLATSWGAKGETAHGSARWRKGAEWAQGLALVPLATLTTVLASGPPAPDAPAVAPDLTPNPQLSGIVVGRRGKKAVLAVGDIHTLLIGVPGVGKTRRVILPTVLWAAAGRESLVFSDPKGELAAMTAGWLQAQGYDVLRLDIRHPSQGKRWNPLAPIRAAMDSGQWATASRLAWTLAHAIVGQQPLGDANQLWSNTSETLIAALVLAVCDGKAAGLTPDQQHLFSAYHLLMTHAQGTALDAWFDTTFPDRHPAKEAYAMIRTAAPETRQSIYVTSTSTLRLFADPEMAWLTSAHDPAWPMGQTVQQLADRLQQKPFALFLVIPDEDSTRYPLATLFLTQLIQTLVDTANSRGRLPRRVTFLLDEFGNLPPIPDFEKALTVGRGRGLRFLLSVQALQQLRDQYDKKAEILSGTCQLWLYLGTADTETAETLSKKCGQKTVHTQSTAHTTGQSGESVTDSTMSRSLLTADEILRWPVGKMLVLQQPGAFPGVLPIPDLSQWPIGREWRLAADEATDDLSVAFHQIARYNSPKTGASGAPLDKPAKTAAWGVTDAAELVYEMRDA